MEIKEVEINSNSSKSKQSKRKATENSKSTCLLTAEESVSELVIHNMAFLLSRRLMTESIMEKR